MISIDGTPVVFIGATRWYATEFLASLTNPEERAAIVALCNRMTARVPNAANREILKDLTHGWNIMPGHAFGVETTKGLH